MKIVVSGDVNGQRIFELEEQTWHEVTDLIKETIFVIHKEAVSRVPVATGILRESIHFDFEETENFFRGLVKVGAHYGPYVEFGTRPHMPPVEPIQKWVEIKSRRFVRTKSGKQRWIKGKQGKEARSIAWAIAMTIKKKGTKAHPYLRPAWEKGIAFFERKLQEMKP